MALRFKVETLEDKVIFHVKGVKIELSYHAASALCNTIFAKCRERKKSHTTKHLYWMEKARQGRKVKVRPSNQKDYDDFLSSLNEAESLQPSMLGKANKGRKWAQPTKKAPKKDERMAAMQAKIKELQERHHITPKQVPERPKERKQNDNR